MACNLTVPNPNPNCNVGNPNVSYPHGTSLEHPVHNPCEADDCADGISRDGHSVTQLFFLSFHNHIKCETMCTSSGDLV